MDFEAVVLGTTTDGRRADLSRIVSGDTNPLKDRRYTAQHAVVEQFTRLLISGLSRMNHLLSTPANRISPLDRGLENGRVVTIVLDDCLSGKFGFIDLLVKFGADLVWDEFLHIKDEFSVATDFFKFDV
ncbi:hypothetical protein ACFQL4_02325 [Halosimplex aquaticum]